MTPLIAASSRPVPPSRSQFAIGPERWEESPETAVEVATAGALRLQKEGRNRMIRLGPGQLGATEEVNCSLSSRVAGCLSRTSELTTWLPWTRVSTDPRLTSIHNVTVQFRMPCGVRQVIFLKKRAGKQSLIQKCLRWRIKHLPSEQGMIKHQERCMRGHSLQPSPPPLSSDSAPAERGRVWTAWNKPATMAALGHSGVKLRHLRPSTSSRRDRGLRSWFAVGL